MKAIVDAASDYGTYVMAHLYTPGCMQRAIRAGVKSLEHAHAMDEETAKMIADNDVFVNPMPQFTEEEIKWNHMGPYSDYVSYRKKKRGSGEAVQAKTPDATELINKYNLKILFGTDMMVTYPDYEPRQGLDFKEYKKRFGSYKGIVAATGNVNDLIKLTTYQNPYPEGEIGVLKKGSFADILVVKGNPVEDLDILYDVDNLLLIMKDGKSYKNIIDQSV
jgi:imidazolonepropionase-like amidohydrolase